MQDNSAQNHLGPSQIGPHKTPLRHLGPKSKTRPRTAGPNQEHVFLLMIASVISRSDPASLRHPADDLKDQKWEMAFHPDKCSTIRISRSRNPITTDYTLKGHTLTTEDYTKYLGIELKSTFSWNRHIDQTVQKANSMMGFLRRNLRVCSEVYRASAYYSIVRPLLEYCSTVWSFFTKEYIQKMKMVQCRADR